MKHLKIRLKVFSRLKIELDSSFCFKILILHNKKWKIVGSIPTVVNLVVQEDDHGKSKFVFSSA